MAPLIWGEKNCAGRYDEAYICITVLCLERAQRIYFYSNGNMILGSYLIQRTTAMNETNKTTVTPEPTYLPALLPASVRNNRHVNEDGCQKSTVEEYKMRIQIRKSNIWCHQSDYLMYMTIPLNWMTQIHSLLNNSKTLLLLRIM